jgi:hypothetical protein
MEAIETPAIRDKPRSFLLEHLPHRLSGTLGMGMRLGEGDAFVQQPGVQFVIALHPQSRGEEALAHQPDLVLHLTLLPAGGRGAGNRVD